MHFKIYPIIFAPTLLVYFSKSGSWITLNQLKVAIIGASTFLLLTYLTYSFYGYQGLYESFLYHLTRKDIRHNFSVFYYPFYLLHYSSFSLLKKFVGIITFIPQLSLLLICALRLGKDLPLAFLIQTMCFVAFNKVITAQYFLWYISLLPLVIPNSTMSAPKGLFLAGIWMLSELNWLAWAGALEIYGIPSYLGIWCASVIFLLINCYIIFQLLQHYKFR